MSAAPYSLAYLGLGLLLGLDCVCGAVVDQLIHDETLQAQTTWYIGVAASNPLREKVPSLYFM